MLWLCCRIVKCRGHWPITFGTKLVHNESLQDYGKSNVIVFLIKKTLQRQTNSLALLQSVKLLQASIQVKATKIKMKMKMKR